MPRKLPPTPKLKRKDGHRKLPKVVLIVCEGKTEKHILDALRAEWRIARSRVELFGQAGVPATLIQFARSKRDELGSKAVEQVWVVFDRDEHPNWNATIFRARTLHFELGVSNPCVELWGILLHEDHTAPLTRQEAQRRLAAVHTGYHHERHPYFDCKLVLAKLADAEKRAATLARRAAEAGDPLGCPSTLFHEVVKALAALVDATE